MTCRAQVWLGDSISYHDQPTFFCERENDHAGPHEAIGMGEGSGPRGRLSAPLFKVMWEDEASVYCPGCNEPYERPHRPILTCETCGSDMLSTEDHTFEVRSPELRLRR